VKFSVSVWWSIFIVVAGVSYVQHEAKMKSVAETMKEVESKKTHLQEEVDQLIEDCARLKAQGISALPCICFTGHC